MLAHSELGARVPGTGLWNGGPDRRREEDLGSAADSPRAVPSGGPGTGTVGHTPLRKTVWERKAGSSARGTGELRACQGLPSVSHVPAHSRGGKRSWATHKKPGCAAQPGLQGLQGRHR